MSGGVEVDTVILRLRDFTDVGRGHSVRQLPQTFTVSK
ncbi:hypothetical protein FRUB_03757 [Fimbriiglobus ruber]|uniref:Uncharacterized protein n=1 Tax=Fimbriiglobus ruber TaxID=1908690 RepID=A0A225DWV9_9BACT|nr:hypothetical protein FRUB_03757 [Fimbriiglobus ruber]